MISSRLTKSPSFFNQVEMVTSVIDSPTAGTFISFTTPVAFGPVATVTGLLSSLGVVTAGAPPADSSTSQINSPIGTVSPCCFFIFNTPALGAVNSNVALSDSRSAIISSI
jgi:hypothetical protein